MNLKQQHKQENNNLFYLIDLTLLIYFVFSFKKGNDNPKQNSLSEYCMSSVEVQYFNALIKNNPIFGQPLKNRQEAYENLFEMSKKWLHKKKPIRLFFSPRYYKPNGIDIALYL